MPFSFRAALVLAVGLSASAASAQTSTPPVAAERPVTLEMHGDTRVDPYFWLREREDPEVIAYLDAENTHFDAQMAPLAELRDELFEEIRGRIQQDDASVPYRVGNHLYASRIRDGEQYPVYVRQPAEGG